MPSGTPEIPQLRSPADTVAQDWGRLREYLGAQGLQLSIDPPPRQFAGGFANLNYLVVIDGQEAVLRRPPLGPLPPGAYDMGRESKILSKLGQHFPLAPRALHLCLDTEVLGAPFQLTEYRRGVSFRDTLPEPLADDPAVGAQLGTMLTDVLAQLHAVDPAAAGLDLGKPEGFLARTVEGWAKRADLAVEGWATPTITRLITEIPAWLRVQTLPQGRVSFLHNDFKLDNVLLNPETLAPVAVLDWDQGTRGDPLFDLATLLSYWTEKDDPPAMHLMAQMPTAGPGFPTRREAAEAYARAANADLSEFRFYRVLATFKTAVIFAQLYARYHAGGTTEPRYARFNELTEGLLVFAHDIAHHRAF